MSTCRQIILANLKEHECCTWDTLERMCAMDTSVDYSHGTFDSAMTKLEDDELITFNYKMLWFELTKREINTDPMLARIEENRALMERTYELANR